LERFWRVFIKEMQTSFQKVRPHNTRPIKIRTAGGAASQLVALLSAIHIKQISNRKFVIEHYPYATGGFYPLAIADLLESDEISSIPGKTKFYKPDGNEAPGMQLDGHPVQKRGVSYENLMKVIRNWRLENVISLLKLEWKLDFSIQRLGNFPPFVKSIGGGFPPFRDQEVLNALVNRARNTKFNVALSLVDVFQPNGEDYVVIHLRLGDKRFTFNSPTTTGDGIVDPICFRQILDLPENKKYQKVFVVSDEPEIAIELLSEVGITAITNPNGLSLLDDMGLMRSASLLLCSWSTVSQFVMCVADLERTRIYYPRYDGTGKQPKWFIQGVELYTPEYLPRTHHIYGDTYTPNPRSYTIYD
jgi:hypothetical protein